MGVYRYNSKCWYHDIQPIWMRLLRWLISIGGWQVPHWTEAGYSYRWHLPAIRRALRARGHRSRLFAIYSSMCPLSLFGGRLTFQSFGVSYYSRRRKGWYCLNYEIVDHGPNWRRQWYAYRSYNATPWGADTWYLGAPREVVQAARAHADQHIADRIQREKVKT